MPDRRSSSWLAVLLGLLPVCDGCIELRPFVLNFKFDLLQFGRVDRMAQFCNQLFYVLFDDHR